MKTLSIIMCYVEKTLAVYHQLADWLQSISSRCVWRPQNDVLRSSLAAIVIAVVIAVSFLTSNTSLATTTLIEGTYQVVRVQGGDTIWSIASRYVSNTSDIRRVIVEIKSINRLDDNAVIYPGQAIKVPIPGR